MLQRTAGFGMISKMLPVWRAYPAHAGQPMAAAPCGVRPSPDFLPKRGRIHAVLRGAGMHDIPAPTRPASVIRLTTLNRRTAAFGQPAR